MTKAVADVYQRAMELNEKQRIELLCMLMDEVVPGEVVSDEELLTDDLKSELDSRARFMDEHPDKLIPMDEVFRKIREELGLKIDP